jgi:hypothetical protein
MMGVFTQLERGVIVARMKAGRAHKAEQGVTLDAEGHRPKRGGTWQPRQVGRILQRVG